MGTAGKLFRTCFYSTVIFLVSALIASAQSDDNNPAPLPGLLEDVQMLAGKSNPERLQILQSILERDGIAYAVETYHFTGAELIERFGGADRFNQEQRDRMLKIDDDGSNLVVTLGSGDAEIVLGAHYDRVDIGEGVVDNGGSSIILARIARALKDNPPGYRLRIVWFGNEEDGLIGSWKYIQQHAGDNIVSMINLDVNGYGDMTAMGPSSQTGVNRLYRLAQSAAVENGYNFTLFPNYPPSDNIPFTQAGIEAISIAIAPADEMYDLWLIMNGRDELKPQHQPALLKNMHSPNDTMALIEPGAITQTYTIVLDMLKKLGAEGGS